MLLKSLPIYYRQTKYYISTYVLILGFYNTRWNAVTLARNASQILERSDNYWHRIRGLKTLRYLTIRHVFYSGIVATPGYIRKFVY